MDPAPPAPSPLDYAPPSSAQRHPVRWIVALLIVGILAFSPRWGPAIWNRIQLTSAVGQCMSHTAPADQVVYDFAPDPTGRIASQHTNFYRLLGTPPPATHASAFIHERARPDGEKRLIFVDLITIKSTPRGSAEAYFWVRIYDPGSLLRPPREVRNRAISTVRAPIDLGSSRIYAGQPDPTDPTHFTITYTSAGRDGIVDGYLHNDDSVTLQPRRLE